jgi:uncharacterized membrane protein YfcA
VTGVLDERTVGMPVADIRVAGSASLIISLAIVATGVWRYHRMGALPETGGPQRIALSMNAGSLIGAALGSLAIAAAPPAFLKVMLGSVLILAAAKTIARNGGRRIHTDGRYAGTVLTSVVAYRRPLTIERQLVYVLSARPGGTHETPR